VVSIKTIHALIMKEAKQIKRDASSILVAFVMPLTILAMFGYGVSFNIENIGVDIVRQDSSRASQNLVDHYVHSKYFNANVVHSIKDARRDIESGRSQGAIVISPSFSRGAQPGAKPAIQVISDGSDPNTASYIESYAMGVLMKYMQSMPKKSGAGNPGMEHASPGTNHSVATPATKTPGAGINIVNRLWFNSTTESINFLMAGVLTMILSIVGAFLTSLVVAKEWERGTMEAMIATPVSLWEIIISKVIPYFVLCVVSFLFSIACGMFLFDVPFEGSIGATSLVTTVFIIVSLLIGLLISTYAKDQFVAAMGAISVTFMPTFMLSGLIFEIKSMPLWLQLLTTVFPARYYVSSIRTLCLAGDVWEIILRDTGILLIMACILALALKKKLKKNVE
jgi:ABC-2 type transport system permease protein